MEDVRAEIDYNTHDPFVKDAVYKYGKYVGTTEIHGQRVFCFQAELPGDVLGNFVATHEKKVIRHLLTHFKRSSEIFPESEVEWITEARNEGMTWKQLSDKYQMGVTKLKQKVGFR